MTNAALIKIIQQGQILNRYQNIKRFITLYSYFSNERLRYYYGSMFLKNAQTGILLRLHSKYHRPLLHVRADNFIWVLWHWHVKEIEHNFNDFHYIFLKRINLYHCRLIWMAFESRVNIVHNYMTCIFILFPSLLMLYLDWSFESLFDTFASTFSGVASVTWSQYLKKYAIV